MPRQLATFAEWTARSLAIVALLFAARPEAAFADATDNDAPSITSDDSIEGVVVDVDVDADEDEDEPAPE